MQKIAFLLALLFFQNTLTAQTFSEKEKQEMCVKVKEACRFAWNGYKKYAWGSDALRPISHTPQNWYKHSLLMTPVDGFDTFTLLGLKEEAKEAKDIILTKLDFNVDDEVQVFEVTIRLLGSLITAYELDGDKRFLNKAEDLGRRLLPAFKTSTGMPYRYVHLQTGAVRDALSNPAETGTLFLEFGKLTQLTGDSSFYKAAKTSLIETYNRRSKLNLVGSVINITTGQWTDTETHISGGIDSYYEYVYKAWLLFGDKDCLHIWNEHNTAVKKYLLRKENNGWFFTHADMNTGKETFPYYGALDAFYAGLLALSGDVATAKKIQQGNFYMWTKFNMEPEEFNFKTDTIVYASYPLRPEILESCFYLYRSTHSKVYLDMGKRIVNDILLHCKTDAGYAAVRNVQTYKLADSMESFFFAETLKYSYLLFAPESLVNLKKIVFNTEAHPLKINIPK
ncbi:MAG: glycoside hydrolase family 47 protein [Chitinophagaceae bacterium]|nr:glycoside hydrolase family 47 protein [Chitinophagaceae bacterium]